MMAALSPEDNARLFRLYEEGATGQPMPMDEASRLSRARDMGFDPDARQYHGTSANFSEFRPSETGLTGRGVYSSMDPSDAVDYVDPVRVDGLWTDATDGVQVIPMVTPPESNYAGFMQYQNALDADDTITHVSNGADLVAAQRRVADGLSSQGYPGVRSRNPEHIVTFEPQSIRSPFARFDPRLSHLAHLSAGGAGVAVLGGQDGQDEQGGYEAALRRYLQEVGQ